MDVRSLLLRLGINAICSRARASKGRPHFPRKAHGRTDVKRFLEIVGCPGEHRTATGSLILEAVGASSPNPNPISAAAARVRRACDGRARNQHSPAPGGPGTRTADVAVLVEPVPRASGMSRARRSVRGSRLAGHERRVLGSRSRVVPDGHEEVFDLTVEGLHNFVAEDIVVQPDRAGRRRRHVRLPRRVLQQGNRAAWGGRDPARAQAPQRADRRRDAVLPAEVSEIREPVPRPRCWASAVPSPQSDNGGG